MFGKVMGTIKGAVGSVGYETIEEEMKNAVSSVLNAVVRGMVDSPDAVRIEYSVGKSTIMCSVIVTDGSAGPLIGRKGQNADSIRRIMQCVSRRFGYECVIDIC